MHARPGPVLRLLDEARPRRVERDIAQGREEMILVHRHRAEPPLPEMAAAPGPGVDVAGIAAMDLRQGAPQTVPIFRDDDQVHMVRHQHPGPDLDAGRPARRRQKIAIGRVIRIAEEDPRPAVAALRHMMRHAGDDEAGETGHLPSSRCRRRKSIKCTVTVFRFLAEKICAGSVAPRENLAICQFRPQLRVIAHAQTPDHPGGHLSLTR